MRYALAFALLLAGCMRCDPFQLACPTGKTCVDGYCQTGCNGQQIRDVNRRYFGVNDCYQCDGNSAHGVVNAAGHYVCEDWYCNECTDFPVPGTFGKHGRDAGTRRDAVSRDRNFRDEWFHGATEPLRESIQTSGGLKDCGGSESPLPGSAAFSLLLRERHVDDGYTNSMGPG